MESGPWQKSTDPGDKGITILEVQEFKDCGNGIFWPLRGYISTKLVFLATKLALNCSCLLC
jgi:hypothetical protein